MGASSSKIEEDKALHLCRERRKFVGQALDGRCSLAASHVAYIQSLRKTGTALRKFVEPELPTGSSPYTSITATPEPFGSAQKTHSHFSFPSPSLSHPVDMHDNQSSTPSPHSSNRFVVNHMKFRGFSSTKVEEKPSVAVTATVTTSSTPTETTPRSARKSDSSLYEASPAPSGTPPWDYFGLFHSTDDHSSFREGSEVAQGSGNTEYIRRLREEEGIPDLESFHGSVESENSEDEFDDPAADTLVRTFENFNRLHDHGMPSASPKTPPGRKVHSESELLNGEKSNSPHLSPLRTASSEVIGSANKKKTPVKEDQVENKVFPKDFISSLKEIEQQFIQASEFGKEVPRMLEANKLHFRPIVPGKESGTTAATLFKACFSCGEDPIQVQKEPAPNSVKYLTWHRTTSSRSASSRNLLGVNDEMEDPNSHLFDTTCMISGSHASTLDRLYAWERKLYDEVKASQVVRRYYDAKCRILRQLESKAESEDKIYKTRADVKDLHSRIRVAIQRIDSISKRIEELRDKELQPQLEELIKGLSRMWKGMSECHKLQLNTISTAFDNGTIKMYAQSESRRQVAIALESELESLSSSFMKWISAQKSYLQAINHWLFKCVFLEQNQSTKRKRRQPASASMTLRHHGPLIYRTCGVWLDEFEKLPAKEVADSIKGLVAEINRFLPLHEKNQAKNASVTSWKADDGSDMGFNILREEASEDCISRFRASLAGFLGQLSNFSDSSVTMYLKLESIVDAKDIAEQSRSL